MNINELASALVEKFGIEGLESKDGLIELEIDGAPVMIEETDGDVFMFNGLVGDGPTEGGDIFARILLEGNVVLIHSKAAVLARNPESGAYVLVERVPVGLASDFENFCTCLGNFVNTLESWRTMLENFNPAAEEAATVSSEDEAETVDALRKGFLRI